MIPRSIRSVTASFSVILAVAFMLGFSLRAAAGAQSQSSVISQRQKKQLQQLSKDVKSGQKNVKKIQQTLRANNIHVNAKKIVPAKQRAQLQRKANQASRAINRLKKQTKKAQGQ